MPKPTKKELYRLKRGLRQAGVTQDRVAKAAKVTVSHVCNVLAGREISTPVIAAAQHLLAQRHRQLDMALARRQRDTAEVAS